MTSVKRVGGLLKVGECVLIAAKRVRRLEEHLRMRFDHRKACSKLAVLLKVRFAHFKVCTRFADLWRARFGHTKRVKGLQKFVE